MTDQQPIYPQDPKRHESHQHPSSTDAASAALTTLFSSTGGAFDLAIDPSLTHDPESDQSASAAPLPDMSSSKENEQPDSQSHSPDEDATTTSQQPPKRKATSRANMLARGGACEFCKRRKLRCTAEVPACAACRRTGRDCVYSQKKQRSRVRILEDRLQELERKLEDQGGVGPGSAESAGGVASAGVSPPRHALPDGTVTATSATSQAGLAPAPLSQTTAFISPESNATPSAGVDLFHFGLASETLGLADLPFHSSSPQRFIPNRPEPDLMTLADAAAADGTEGQQFPWEGMEPRAVASELVKAVMENGKGIGEKIVAHLLQVWARSAGHLYMVMLNLLVSPNSFFGRLSGQGPTPHPALLAGIIPQLQRLSPSPTLSNLEACGAVTDALTPPARVLTQHALSTLDTRMMDLIAGATLRSTGLTMHGRFVDAHLEIATAMSTAWATGLGKLGGIGEMFAPAEFRSADYVQRVERESRIRRIRTKSQMIAPPANGQELADRITLFWVVYVIEKCDAICLNFPSLMVDEEITTPLPLESYDSSSALCENTTLADFLTGAAVGGGNECYLRKQVKAVALLNAVGRLLDLPASLATPERTHQLLRLTKKYMAALPPFLPMSREEAIQRGSDNEVWMSLHGCMHLLYLKEEIDAPSASEEDEARNKAIESGMRMVACVEQAMAAGDTNLEACDFVALSVWYIVGRSLHQLAIRIEPNEPERAAMLRQKVDVLVESTRIAAERLKLGEVHHQQIKNVTLGSERMIGEWERPDNVVL